MSILSNCEIKCNCGETFEAEVWKAVNVFDDPDLKDVILSGRFNTVECPHCKKVFYHAVPPHIEAALTHTPACSYAH